MCVCVCVTPWEREREKKNPRMAVTKIKRHMRGLWLLQRNSILSRCVVGHSPNHIMFPILNARFWNHQGSRRTDKQEEYVQRLVTEHPFPFLFFRCLLSLQDSPDTTDHGDGGEPVEVWCRRRIRKRLNTHCFFLFFLVSLKYDVVWTVVAFFWCMSLRWNGLLDVAAVVVSRGVLRSSTGVLGY